MIKDQKETVGLTTGAMGIGKSVVPDENRTPTLADAGIDKKLSSRTQKMAECAAFEEPQHIVALPGRLWTAMTR